MRQLNFFLIFATCLSLALFSIANTQPVTLMVLPGVGIEAPLSIVLVLTLGGGALMAWVFSLWDQLQRQWEAWRNRRELKDKDKRIQSLEKELAALKEQIAPTLPEALPPADLEPETETMPSLVSSEAEPAAGDRQESGEAPQVEPEAETPIGPP